jgi:hypothetical protein
MEGRRVKDVLRATTLALLGAVVLAPGAPAQTSFEVTVQLPGSAADFRLPSLDPDASVPDISSEVLRRSPFFSPSVWRREARRRASPTSSPIGDAR